MTSVANNCSDEWKNGVHSSFRKKMNCHRFRVDQSGNFLAKNTEEG